MSQQQRNDWTLVCMVFGTVFATVLCHYASEIAMAR